MKQIVKARRIITMSKVAVRVYGYAKVAVTVYVDETLSVRDRNRAAMKVAEVDTPDKDWEVVHVEEITLDNPDK